MDKNQEVDNQLEDLKNKLEQCEKTRDEYLAGWQRAKADFLNYKKEESERLDGILVFIKAGWILKLLDIYDNFERAEKFIPALANDSEWVKGILQIENQFNNFLKEDGIEEIKAEGEKFNPEFHESIEEIEKEGAESGMIAEVLEKGYLLNGRVIRPVKVKVVK